MGVLLPRFGAVRCWLLAVRMPESRQRVAVESQSAAVPMDVHNVTLSEASKESIPGGVRWMLISGDRTGSATELKRPQQAWRRRRYWLSSLGCLPSS